MKISVQKGTFSYTKKGPEVLRDISFEAEGGDVVAILGPNGAGKTTLLKCIMGFLSWKGGQSLLDGENIREIPPRRLWQSLAYVPQARQAAAAYTVEETVLLGRSSHIGPFSRPGEEDIREAYAAMERLNITHLAKKNCGQLSGGELQMVLIARAIAARPRVLILDEPESNLDFKNQLLVLEAMSALAAEGMLCIFNTHYPAHALRRANKALLLEKGGRCLFGSTHQVVTEENIEKAFGVKAYVGEVDTPGKTLRDVVAVSILEDRKEGALLRQQDTERTLASLSLITGDNSQAEAINSLLHEYGRWLVGRMGMPYRAAGVYILHITLDAPRDVILTLAAKLGMLPRVDVKTTFYQGQWPQEES